MVDISLHLLDLMQNSARAQATEVALEVAEDRERDTLTVTVTDNGKGMDDEEKRLALDPFYTTKQGKKVGLGLPLVMQAARMCGGDVKVESGPGSGTKVQVTFSLSHLDRQPLGDIPATLVSFMAGNPDIELSFSYVGEKGTFHMTSSRLFSKREKETLGQIALLSLAEERLRAGLARAGFRPDGGGVIG
ncbi:MAG TPA: ATP-binding protein [Firmicutes bacterium]|nr:ATP-binding protein [Candidatus Fermentithermobacillaceae bacterium]